MNPAPRASATHADPAPRLAIVEALLPAEMEQVRALFLAYARSLDFSLCFQDFDQELAGLPGFYARPGGRLLLGLMDRQPVGCVGLRPLEPGVCEMKRLYVQPEARGSGLGARLAWRTAAEARAEGYDRLRLDTMPSLEAATALYRKMGFVPIGNYCGNPMPGALFFELDLRRAAGTLPGR
jgi:ribosomal protein S18 acetylase RimI-like enzyme